MLPECLKPSFDYTPVGSRRQEKICSTICFGPSNSLISPYEHSSLTHCQTSYSLTSSLHIQEMSTSFNPNTSSVTYQEPLTDLEEAQKTKAGDEGYVRISKTKGVNPTHQMLAWRYGDQVEYYNLTERRKTKSLIVHTSSDRLRGFGAPDGKGLSYEETWDRVWKAIWAVENAEVIEAGSLVAEIAMPKGEVEGDRAGSDPADFVDLGGDSVGTTSSHGAT